MLMCFLGVSGLKDDVGMTFRTHHVTVSVEVSMLVMFTVA